ncbi:carboxypeptidase-like regulatory domain-containing protein [Gammaproteobacteria bacterium]|nr:carboxypeptidase-like regulatory domain-containing protein [Gammaproteobacteria bacterium]
MDKQDLLDAALDYIKTEAGKKAIGVDLDIENLKKVTTKATGKIPTAEELQKRLKSYIPKIEKFTIEGRLYDKITSEPIEGAKVEPLLALGKKTFTDKNGEFIINLELPVLPFNNKALVESKLIYTKSGYIPQYAELLTQKREVKSDLKAKPLINTKLAADQAVEVVKEEVYSKIAEASKLAASLPEKILLVRRKAIEKFTNAILFKLLPLAIGLMLIFGITKIKDRNKKICPTPSQLKRAAKTRNSIARQINQIYVMVIVNVGLAVLFNYIAIQLRGIRMQITTMPFPVATPPGVGVPQSLLSGLQNIKDILKTLADANKKLNIQLIVALIFFIAAMIILSMIIKTVDSLIFECAKDQDIELEELNPAIQDLANGGNNDIVTPNQVAGFTLEVVELDKNNIGKYKRRQAVGKNSQGVILVRGDQSFSNDDSALINELIFYIRSNDLKAY